MRSGTNNVHMTHLFVESRLLLALALFVCLGPRLSRPVRLVCLLIHESPIDQKIGTQIWQVTRHGGVDNAHVTDAFHRVNFVCFSVWAARSLALRPLRFSCLAFVSFSCNLFPATPQMAKKSSSRREFSIPGDELEQHRIQLEHNLQNTDLSLHLSSVPDDDAAADESLEYPRHGSVPDHFPAFASFDRYSRENMDLDASHVRAWSIHGDEGITPYDVRTMSTPAHHASAVTITAGLARSGKREPSFSGAEYDPERPLQDIIAGMEHRFKCVDIYSPSSGDVVLFSLSRRFRCRGCREVAGYRPSQVVGNPTTCWLLP
jgi:hypothetical protein